ncbi:sensor domain-containing diguanylate cyclase [Calidifontibacillus oryziterrae]|uniref:sensor domain-containing diguanylate cyclase n=1 Tax=Calidifontibacillus oryziterrae TaxID=1191699 RepID=UPI0002D5943C|nr:sensor domain-containing diguanylate cyclase [Calidifontibacillus oryziterrae]
MGTKNGIKLTFAMSLLVVFTVCSTTVVNWYLSVHALKSTLTDNHLENNYRYAQKVLNSTTVLLNDMEHNLSTLADVLGKKELSQSDLDAWRDANSGYYNSLFTTDSQGVVQLMSPQVLPSNPGGVRPGTKIQSDLMKQALKNKQPFISDPYLAQTGNLVVLVSYPIFDQQGNFKGVVDGTIYLESNNSMKRLLEQHEFLDETSVFVVDHSGRIIYHPDSTRINQSAADHPLVQRVIEGRNGSEQIQANGFEYFSGYAYIEPTRWGIITQTPTSVIDKPLNNLTKIIIVQSLPLLLLILLLGWLFANQLTKPINTLARYSEEAILSKKEAYSIHRLEIKSAIYEVRKLCHHIQRHFQLLNNQIQQDGLTGLANRRSFDLEIEKLVRDKVPFSLIMLDIDHFKVVNDQYGHLVGDDVLRFLALIMQDVCREDDLCFRYGGEEFVILLKYKNVDKAQVLAERLRLKVAETPSPTGHPIYISLGISAYEDGDENPEVVIKRADMALYRSKNEGRNRTTIY